MTRALRHRGPGRRGLLRRASTTTASRVGLGFRRLSIIDLGPATSRSRNEDGSVQLVFNGEIYNYRELRQRLEARGHRFRRADTEVIVHLYEELRRRLRRAPERHVRVRALGRRRGASCPRARSLREEAALLRRRSASTLLFGSELKALLEHPRCPTELDSRGLSRYLALEYVPAPHSIFAGVAEAARRARAALARRRVVDRAVLGPVASSADERGDRDDEYADELRARSRDAVRRRLVSDVPLGVFLCGGIDSSSVVAMMADASCRRRTSRRSRSDSRSRASTSRSTRGAWPTHFGTDHHEDVLHAADVARPAADGRRRSSTSRSPTLRSCPTYLLSRFTREHVTVALGGDGGDELLAGYPTFPADRVARLLPRAAPAPRARGRPARRPAAGLDGQLQPRLQAEALPARARLADDVRHPVWLGSFTPRRAGCAPHRGRRRSVRGAAAGSCTGAERGSTRAADLPLREDLPPGRHPREGRPREHGVLARGAGAVPRLELVEFLGRVPLDSSSPLRHQALLKRAMADVCRPGSRPQEEGLRDPGRRVVQGRAAEALQDELSPERFRRQGIFDAAEVEATRRPSTCRAGEITASRSGRCSCSSSGIGAGSRVDRDIPRQRASCRDRASRPADEAASSRISSARSRPTLCSSTAKPTATSRAAELVCAGCGRGWAVRRGVPRLVPPDLVEQQRRTAARSACSGSTSPRCTQSTRRSFSTGSIRSTGTSSVSKRVLDAGCGTGRHAYFAARYGASEVVGARPERRRRNGAPHALAVRERRGRPG